jgi:hypothetical protein
MFAWAACRHRSLIWVREHLWQHLLSTTALILLLLLVGWLLR